MSISVGDTLANRFVLEHALPSTPDILRYRGLDTQTQSAVEIIIPSATALIRPQQREFFLQTHKENQGHSGYLSCLFCAEEKATPYAVYPAIAGIVQEDLRLDLEKGQQVLQYLHGILQQHPLPAEEGLQPSNLIVDKEGSLLLRPNGIVPKRSKITFDVHTHPERIEDQQFSLAMIIYCATFGIPELRKRVDFLNWIENPPSLETLNPDIAPELNGWLTAMIKGEATSVPSLESCSINLPNEATVSTTTAPTQMVITHSSQAKEDLEMP